MLIIKNSSKLLSNFFFWHKRFLIALDLKMFLRPERFYFFICCLVSCCI